HPCFFAFAIGVDDSKAAPPSPRAAALRHRNSKGTPHDLRAGRCEQAGRAIPAGRTRHDAAARSRPGVAVAGIAVARKTAPPTPLSPERHGFSPKTVPFGRQ